MTCTADEDGKRSWEFTDGKDRTVLLRTQSASSMYENTYYEGIFSIIGRMDFSSLDSLL